MRQSLLRDNLFYPNQIPPNDGFVLRLEAFTPHRIAVFQAPVLGVLSGTIFDVRDLWWVETRRNDDVSMLAIVVVPIALLGGNHGIGTRFLVAHTRLRVGADAGFWGDFWGFVEALKHTGKQLIIIRRNENTHPGHRSGFSMNDGTVGAGDEVVSGEIFSLSAHVVLVGFGLL